MPTWQILMYLGAVVLFLATIFAAINAGLYAKKTLDPDLLKGEIEEVFDIGRTVVRRQIAIMIGIGIGLLLMAIGYIVYLSQCAY